MAAWSRNTPWRQGHFIPPALAGALGLISNHNEIVIVVSHDCDIAQDPEHEPDIEIFKAYVIPEINGNNAHAKNARALHISVRQEGVGEIAIELLAVEKQKIPKKFLSEHLPDTELSLEPLQRKVLQQWLASRYKRTAFPDDFDERLKVTKMGRKVQDRLASLGDKILAVYLDIDGGKEINHAANEPYVLRIFPIYNVDVDPDEAAKAAQEACDKIKEDFKKICLKDGVWENFELVDCMPISATALTYQLSRTLTRWTIDHLSLRNDTDAVPE